ncbi:GNAT family N-acetyltransferase [Cesiribacter sp. SM1]|uniref:GNAT family N-acetyltransferase n=1 Tax=Cesiribacter sp. SM1 TaxID=2861196 RepID=UPI001CD4F242|nr:GNAT family N-acetyltransferase [Cesiribacter sp. SM1]
MQELTFITKQGNSIRDVFDDLAALRIAVFHDYPYLYEGTPAYEKEYLQPYVRSERSFLFAVYHDQQMVGATTCIPLLDETAEIRQPFEEAGYALDTLFYFGESILLNPYRGKGLGHRFFDEREAHARSFGTYRKACFFSVEREPNHPQKPVNYRPNDEFWKKRGYVKQAQLQTTLSWPDIGQTHSTPKPLVCWMRDL